MAVQDKSVNVTKMSHLQIHRREAKKDAEESTEPQRTPETAAVCAGMSEGSAFRHRETGDTSATYVEGSLEREKRRRVSRRSWSLTREFGPKCEIVLLTVSKRVTMRMNAGR